MTDFLKFMNHWTGAVFINFVAYTDEDCKQTYGRQDLLKQFCESNPHSEMRISSSSLLKKGITKAPIILLACGKSLTLVWIYHILLSPPMNLFCAENMEEVDSQEALEFDDEAYLILLDNIPKLRLHHWKGILSQFMVATRHMCHPWFFSN